MDRNVFNTLEIFELVQDHGQGNFGFEAGQRGTDAEVNAMSKGQMAIGLALDIELIRFGKLSCVTIG